MRCLSLADVLTEYGANCSFICRQQSGHLMGLIEQRGYQLLALPSVKQNQHHYLERSKNLEWLGTDWATDANDTHEVLDHVLDKEAIDWLVVDHYGLASEWEKTLRPRVRRVMVIDDLADREHDCDLLLDQNLGRNSKDYSGLVTLEANRVLTGPKYALLRTEFSKIRVQSLARRFKKTELKHLLISMGGVDRGNITGHLLDVLKNCKLPADLQITIVMGKYSPWLAQVKAQAVQMQIASRVLVEVGNMAQLMADSDLAIGAAGGTAWERCCLGLPSLVLVLAENQKEGATALQNAGAALVFELPEQITEIFDSNKSRQSINELLSNLSNSARNITDGLGCMRVANRIMEKDFA